MIPQWTFGQRGAAWANWLINNVAGSTLGKYGCTTAAYGVGLGHYLGKPMNPKDTEIFIRQNKAYLGDLVDWRNLPYFRSRFYCEATPAPLEDIRNELRNGKMVLLHVDLVANDDKPDHWVLCLDENFTIFDPWYDEVAPITKRYGKPEREIFGGAYFNWPIKPNEPTMSASDMEELKRLREYTPQLEKRLQVIQGAMRGVFRQKDEAEVRIVFGLDDWKYAGFYGARLDQQQVVDISTDIGKLNYLLVQARQTEAMLRTAIGERDADVKRKSEDLQARDKRISELTEELAKIRSQYDAELEAMRTSNTVAVQESYDKGRIDERQSNIQPAPENPSGDDVVVSKSAIERLVSFFINLISKK